MDKICTEPELRHLCRIHQTEELCESQVKKAHVLPKDRQVCTKLNRTSPFQASGNAETEERSLDDEMNVTEVLCAS